MLHTWANHLIWLLHHHHLILLLPWLDKRWIIQFLLLLRVHRRVVLLALCRQAHFASSLVINVLPRLLHHLLHHVGGYQFLILHEVLRATSTGLLEVVQWVVARLHAKILVDLRQLEIHLHLRCELLWVLALHAVSSDVLRLDLEDWLLSGHLWEQANICLASNTHSTRCHRSV